jgi:hypothetical protein
MDDLCEQWVAEGETGGLATFVCFILLVSHSFGRIGRARKRMLRDRKQEWLLWFIGVALFSHVVAFFGISYFDQTKFSWFALLCIISVATTPAAAATTLPKHRIDQAQLNPDARTMIPEPTVATVEVHLLLNPDSANFPQCWKPAALSHS